MLHRLYLDPCGRLVALVGNRERELETGDELVGIESGRVYVVDCIDRYFPAGWGGPVTDFRVHAYVRGTGQIVDLRAPTVTRTFQYLSAETEST